MFCPKTRAYQNRIEEKNTKKHAVARAKESSAADGNSCILNVCVCVCVCVGRGGGACVRACVGGWVVRACVLAHALRIVFTDMILRFLNTLIHYYY